MLRNSPDVPEGLDFDKMLQTMGVDPKTGMLRNVLTNRMQLVEISETSLVIEVEMASSQPAGLDPQKHRLTIPAQEPPDEEVRTVVADTPGSYAEVVRAPLSAMTPTKPPMISQETLRVPGRTLDCQTTESWLRLQDREMWIKMWTSPEVPGHVVRHEMKADDQIQVMILTSFEKK